MFQKKLMSQSGENLRTEGRADGETLFYGTIPAESGGPKMKMALVHNETSDLSLTVHQCYKICPGTV